MITKTKTSSRLRTITKVGVNEEEGYTSVSSSDVITYDDGPKYLPKGGCNWKTCYHNSKAKSSGSITYTYAASKWDRRTTTATYYAPYVFSGKAVPQLKPDIDGCIGKFWDAVNLNCSESVMCYSGIIQMVPMLGAAFKVNRVLRAISEHVSKRLRKKPFRTVLADLISGDFINRFVIKPTLQDMAMIRDASDYVLRTLETAHRRNLAPTAFEQKVGDSKTVRSALTFSDRYTGGNTSTYFDGYCTEYNEVSTTLKILAQVRYRVDPTSSIRLLANRLGLTRPLDSAWDLVPFSFVIDYFARVGDFISGLSDRMASDEGLEGELCSISDVWVIEKAKVGYAFELTGFHPQQPDTVINGPKGSFSLTSSSFKRYRLPDPLTRIGYWDDKGDFIKPKLSSTRVRTLLQLALQSKLR